VSVISNAEAESANAANATPATPRNNPLKRLVFNGNSPILSPYRASDPKHKKKPI
jgi:hypothetical protein